MFVIKRNQVIVTALVIMIAVAGYLNYVDNKSITDAESEVAMSESSETALVPNDEVSVLNVSSNTAKSIPELELDGEIAISVTDEESTAAEGMENITSEDEDIANDNPGAAVFVSSQTENVYFVQAKLDREQARAKQKEILSDMLSNKNLDKEERSECAAAMLDIQKRIEKETSAEAMIEAKGFTDAYVRIDDDTVDVVVNKEALSDAERAQIEDIVARKTGVDASKIRISPLKK